MSWPRCPTRRLLIDASITILGPGTRDCPSPVIFPTLPTYQTGDVHPAAFPRLGFRTQLTVVLSRTPSRRSRSLTMIYNYQQAHHSEEG